MITGYQISITEGRVHLYVIAGYGQLLGEWKINAYIDFLGGECSELLPTDRYGLPTFGVDVYSKDDPHFVNRMAQDYAELINTQIGDGPLPVSTLVVKAHEVLATFDGYRVSEKKGETTNANPV